MLLLLGALIFRRLYDSSESRIDSLDTFNNGIVFYYDKSTPQAAKRVIIELSDELNIDLLSLDINKDKNIIAHYLDQNTGLIDEYSKIKDLELALKELKSKILEFSTIQESQLNQLLQLQLRPRLRVPLYAEVNNDLDNIPLLKFIYNGNVRKSISLKPELYENKNGQLSKEELKEYLVQEWFNNYSDSTDGKI